MCIRGHWNYLCFAFSCSDWTIRDLLSVSLSLSLLSVFCLSACFIWEWDSCETDGYTSQYGGKDQSNFPFMTTLSVEMSLNENLDTSENILVMQIYSIKTHFLSSCFSQLYSVSSASLLLSGAVLSQCWSFWCQYKAEIFHITLLNWKIVKMHT